jgi:Zn-dependent peptidase ImmA (M78 family)
MKVKNINIKVLKEILELNPYFSDRIKKKFPNSQKWILGEDFPTYKQLVELSKYINIPFGYFFLDELPRYDFPIPHYRTLKNNNFIPSQELLDTIKFAQKIQELTKDVLLEWGHNKLEFAGKYQNKFDLNAIVDELKIIFDVNEGWAKSQKTWKQALKYLVGKAEEKGIIVLINGVVGNNTRRKLNVEEFRGFVLYDEIAPVVFINNNDSLTAKIFTFIHEIVHILIGQSASFDLKDFQASDDEVESFCDQCTAEFLVPKEEIQEIFKNIQDYEKLAKYFKVSKIVIARRLLDLNLISKSEFLDFLKNYQKNEYKSEYNKVHGGNFYENVKLRLGRRFLSILKSAVENNTISLREALLITNLNINNFYKIMNKII